MAIEMRCRKNDVARSSPVDSAILLPTHSTNSHPCCPQEPNVSIAIGTKSYDLFKSTYFANFVASADTAAAPATRSVELRCDGATVSGHVKSHARHFPFFCGNSVIPSGRRSSTKTPVGSRTVAIPAVWNARWMISFTLECLMCRPALLLRDKP